MQGIAIKTHRIAGGKHELRYLNPDPFDQHSEYYMGKTAEQLQREGYIILSAYTQDTYPVPEDNGKAYLQLYNPATQEIYYEYSTRPESEDAQRIAALESAQSDQVTAATAQAQAVANLAITGAQKDAAIAAMAQTIASMAIEIQQLKGGAQNV